jgi:hypothetical protein
VPKKPPVVSAGGSARLRARHTFERQGHFSDALGSAWTATVGYGDGTDTKRLSFTASKRFVLKHTYARAGTFHVVVRVKSSTGLTGSARVKVVVTRR